MKKQPELTALTRQNIVDAFWKIYSTKRIEKITVREVMDIAGYNRGTFYEYFVDVYDVLEQIESNLLPTNEKLPVVKIPDNPDAPYVFNTLFDYYEKNSGYLTVLLGEHGDPSFLPRMKKVVAPIIKQGLKTSGVKDDFKLDVLVEYNLSSMLGVFNLWFTMEERPPLHEFVKFIYDIKNLGETRVLEGLHSAKH